MLKIRLYGEAVLREKSKTVEKATNAVRRLASDMIESMKKYGGVGLAAPQVGKSQRMAILYHPEFHPEPLTLINPMIIERADDLAAADEGCLSIPDLNVSVARPRAIRVRYMDLKGNPVEREFLDLLSRIVQHEIDHLDGKMIVDHLDLERRLRFEAQIKRNRNKPRGST